LGKIGILVHISVAGVPAAVVEANVGNKNVINHPYELMLGIAPVEIATLERVS
jgi:hypothetical protein